MSERYKVVEGSESGHCCFKATVVDTQTSNPSFCDELDWVCECFDMESAQKIADALNTAHLVGDVKYDTALFCDLKTDEEKSTLFLLGRVYETGVIALAIQNDVAMAYHRCSEYRKELEALRDECERLRKLLRHAQPIMRAHAGASHMLDGFRPKRNQWDELAEAIDAAIEEENRAG